MAKQAKGTKRTKTEDLPKTKQELSAENMKKVKGGQVVHTVDKSSPVFFEKCATGGGGAQKP